MSVCGCTVGRDTRSSFDVEAGPIWSNQHAQSVCPAVCDAARWTGAYTRDTARSQSTCTLDYPGRIASAVRVAFAPRAVVAPRRPVTRHAYRPVRAHRRY
ncbi:MAG: hypothetical protein KC635_23075 [Myxococcales bacterium]|nr:hypothetical protein [Myxococcales bacterium]